VSWLFCFWEQASVASAVAQLSVARAGVVAGWGVVFVGVFGRGGGYVPRLVATLRLPADAARLTHVVMF
jgi:hypothetical protein